MTLRAWTLLTLALVFATAACQKSEKQGAAEGTSTVPAAAPSPPASAADDGEGIATEEDFEDEAEQKISSQNADEELDKLEKEIAD